METEMNRDQLNNRYGMQIAAEIVKRNAEPETIASEEGITLYRWLQDGTEVVQTNGDSVWDTDEGFRELVSELSPTGV